MQGCVRREQQEVKSKKKIINVEIDIGLLSKKKYVTLKTEGFLSIEGQQSNRLIL